MELEGGADADWTCPCGELLQAHFINCWSCGTGREGQQDTDFGSEALLPGECLPTSLPDDSVTGALELLGSPSPAFSDATGLLAGVRVGRLLPHERIHRGILLLASVAACARWLLMFRAGMPVFKQPLEAALPCILIGGGVFLLLQLIHLGAWALLQAASRRICAEFQVAAGRSSWLALAYRDCEAEGGGVHEDGGVLGCPKPGVVAFLPVEGEPEEWPLAGLQHVRLLPPQNLLQWAWRGTGPVRLAWRDGTWMDFLVYDGAEVVQSVESERDARGSACP